MTPKEIVIKWVEIFNKADAPGLADLYNEKAINHQVNTSPLEGKEAIKKMFEDGEWAMLEWKDPLGLRGCGFFHVVNDKIIFQRGYWDRLTFLRQHGLAIPKE